VRARLGAALLPALLVGCGSAPPAALAGRFVDLDGAGHDPLRVEGAPAHVLVFLLSDCPIANAYAPEIRAIRRAFEPAGVRFFLVHVDPALDVEAARAHAREYGHAGPVLIDRGHELVRATGVTVTPEAAVLGPGGELLYRGRIDDLYADVGRKRHRATNHDLRAALAAIVAGQPPPVARTTAVGCFIADVAATGDGR